MILRAHPRLLTLCLAGLLQFPPAPAFPQSDSGDRDLPRMSDVIERTEVRVLLVDVYVTDEKGNPIDHLEEKDFELLIDGDPAPIDSFEHRVFHVPVDPRGLDRGPEAEAVSTRTSRRVVFLFDAYNSTMAGQHRVRKQALEYMEKNLFPSDEVMILSIMDRLEIVQPFTRDPDLWVEAVRRLTEEGRDLPSYRSERADRLREIERLANQAKIEAQQERYHSKPTRCSSVWGEARANVQREWERTRFSVNVLEGLVFALGGIAGRKSIVYISDGLDMIVGEPFIAMAYAAGDGICAGHASRVQTHELFIEEDYLRLFEEANAANVTFHTIDARNAVVGAQPFLSDLAFQTGGTRGTASARGGKNFEMLAKRMASYYVLGHTLTSFEPDGRTHNIRIRVSRPDVEVRHRRKFTDAGWRKRDENAVQGALAVPELYRDLPVQAQIIPIRQDEKTYETYFEIGIPVTDLFWLPFTDTRLGEVEFIGAVTGRKGDPVFEFGEILELSRSGESDHGGEGLYYRTQTVLKPGDYELIAVGHDLGNGLIGGMRREFRISAERSKRLTTNSVVLAKISRGDLVVGDYSSTPMEKAMAGLPRKYRKERVVPLFPEDAVTRKDSLVTYFQLQRPAGEGGDSRSRLKVNVNFMQYGERQYSVGPVTLEPEAIRPDGSTPVAVVAPLRRFKPGTYDVRIEVKREGWSEVLWKRNGALTILPSAS